MVKINNKQHITKDGIVKRNPQKAQIGDDKLPNKYWVSVSNDFFICKNGVCDWASESLNFKPKGKTLKMFDTFIEALQYIDNNVFLSDVPKEDTDNFINIDDRISGEIWHSGIYVYDSSQGLIKSKKIEYETYRDTRFTEDEMRKRGYEFK